MTFPVPLQRTLVSMIVALTVTILSAADPVVLHVACNGNDAWSGKRAAPSKDDRNGPLATLEQARKAVRRLKAQNTDRNIVVLLRGGTYRLERTLVFSPDDAASPNTTITYAAYPVEKPVLSARPWQQ